MTFVFLVVLIVGFVNAVRRPKLIKLRPQDFPRVDPAKFSEWQEAKLKAIDRFLWASWGGFIISSGVLLLARVSALSQTLYPVLSIGISVVWLGWLWVASTYGSRADKLKKTADIEWP